MANVLTVKKATKAGGGALNERKVRYSCVLSPQNTQAVRGSNVGEVLNLGTATGNNDPMEFWGYTGPSFGEVLQGPAGYVCQIIPGADGLHWLLKVWSGVGTELPAGAYPAAILADTLDMIIQFRGASYR